MREKFLSGYATTEVYVAKAVKFRRRQTFPFGDTRGCCSNASFGNHPLVLPLLHSVRKNIDTRLVNTGFGGIVFDSDPDGASKCNMMYRMSDPIFGRQN